MVRRIRAGNVKTALYEITKELVAKGTYSTPNAVRELRSKHGKAVDADLQDVLDMGLKVIAGIVRSRPNGSADQGDLTRELGIREFETFFFNGPDGKSESKVVNVLDSTLEVYDARVVPVKKSRAALNVKEGSAKYFEEMREQGLVGVTLRRYLADRR
ncbi:hypothetical protein FJ546_30830 [Mesorhizobium sp. B2-4-19]|uniref:hypothetical protein n=1 Tax=Mesorhizobium sp. B2-4-19 TaxID=2589930 RepID=UPI001127EA89|nr:hypothetical protein [Mesorhizobium sp. B2-4-19]TPK52091.1 hypothetical protein FJ546_30830 [Mesorhizobium sp. B2-4-19]